MLDLLFERGARTGDLCDPDTARLQAQVANLFHRGLIVAVDLEQATAKVQVGECTTASLPWLCARAGGDMSWWAPEVGEHVAVICPCGSLSQGVILGSLYSGARPAPARDANQHVTSYADGTTIVYDRAAHKLSIHAVGDIAIDVVGNATLKATAVTLTASDGATVQGKLSIDGDLSLSGKVDGGLKVAGSIKATGAVSGNAPTP